MRASTFTLVVCGLSLTALADDTKDNAILKEIDLKGEKLTLERDARFDPPKVITDAEELAKVFPDKATREKLAKGVNFDRHKLIYFAWGGSGGDRVETAIREKDGKKEVEIIYSPGATDDYRRHFRLYRINKDIAWKVRK